MKKLFMFGIAALLLSSCDKDAPTTASSFEMQPSAADYAAASLLPVSTVTGNVTSNAVWDNGHVWELNGIVVVTADTLTIQPGTFIKGAPNTESVLLISKGTYLKADGGSCETPIVFTSYKLLDNNAATTATPGDIAGLILLGEAPVNTGVTTNVIEGLNNYTGSVSDLYYGGSDSTDNSGILRYVRIEFAGLRIGLEDAGNEVNGLTCGAVGSGTTIDYVQVSYGLDDGFEFFGGTVNASHLVAFACDDDSFDFDQGYRGTVTYAVSVANNATTHSASSGAPDSNGIELDNDAAGSPNTPITRPTIEYLSIYGSSACNTLYENGIHVRRNGDLILRNSTVSGYPTGIRVETNSSAITTSTLPVSVSAFTGVTAGGGTFGTGISGSAACSASNEFSVAEPFYTPGSCSLLDFTTPSSVTTGAFEGGTDWTNCWTKFCDFETVYE